MRRYGQTSPNKVRLEKNQTKPVLNVISISIGLVYIVTRQTGSFFFPTTKKENTWQYFLEMRIKEKKNFNLEMERMIKQQIFALEMDALTSRLQ